MKLRQAKKILKRSSTYPYTLSKNRIYPDTTFQKAAYRVDLVTYFHYMRKFLSTLGTQP